jgi:dihydrofolate reductase
MKLKSTTFLTLDGVMQGVGAMDEDPSGGFARGGWGSPYFDQEVNDFVSELYQRAGAFLLGNRTYEIFADYWPKEGDDPDNPIGVALNTKPKYVVSTTLAEPDWANTTVVSSDLAAAVAKLKAAPGGELLVVGSGVVIRSLLERHLLDEVNLLTFPVIVGQGKRLFPEKGPDIQLVLVQSQSMSNGVIAQDYRPNGRPQYRDSAPG